jgi:hypothetical protein
MTDNAETPMRAKAEAASRQAAAKVIARARQLGTGIIVYEDGQILERTWQEMEEALERQSIHPREE